jgi:hypothetical protein
MAKVRVYVACDETGGIVSIGRPSEGVAAFKLGGDGQSVFETEVDEGAIEELVGGGDYVADPTKGEVKRYK